MLLVRQTRVTCTTYRDPRKSSLRNEDPHASLIPLFSINSARGRDFDHVSHYIIKINMKQTGNNYYENTQNSILVIITPSLLNIIFTLFLIAVKKCMLYMLTVILSKEVKGYIRT